MPSAYGLQTDNHSKTGVIQYFGFFCSQEGTFPQGRAQGFPLGQEPRAGGGVLGRGNNPSTPARGSLENAVNLQQDSGRSLDRPMAYHYFQYAEWPLLTLYLVSFINPLVPSVPRKGTLQETWCQKTPFNIQMKNVSYQSPEVLSNRTFHVLPWK